MQTARVPHADCFRSLSERAVGAGRGRTSVTGRWDGLLKQTARVPHADCFKVCQSGPWGRAVDGRPWRAAGMYFWNKWHGFLAPIVSKVSQSGPWGRAVDGRPWRAAGMDFWNKRHEFLTPIVSKVCQSGPWGRAVDGRPWRAAGMDFWNEWHSFPRRLFQKSVRAGRGRTAVTGCWDELFKTNGTDSWRRLFQKSFRAGRGIAGYGLAGSNIVGIRSSDFLVGRFSSQKWEILNIIFLNLPVLIVFLDRKSRHAMGQRKLSSFNFALLDIFATRSSKNASDFGTLKPFFIAK